MKIRGDMMPPRIFSFKQ